VMGLVMVMLFRCHVMWCERELCMVGKVDRCLGDVCCVGGVGEGMVEVEVGWHGTEELRCWW